jgi:hypothetical protein
MPAEPGQPAAAAAAAAASAGETAAPKGEAEIEREHQLQLQQEFKAKQRKLIGCVLGGPVGLFVLGLLTGVITVSERAAPEACADTNDQDLCRANTAGCCYNAITNNCTALDECEPVCAPGFESYANLGVEPCIACEPGWADTDTDPTTPCAICDPGSFAGSQSIVCAVCDGGTADTDGDSATMCAKPVCLPRAAGAPLNVSAPGCGIDCAWCLGLADAMRAAQGRRPRGRRDEQGRRAATSAPPVSMTMTVVVLRKTCLPTRHAYRVKLGDLLERTVRWALLLSCFFCRVGLGFSHTLSPPAPPALPLLLSVLPTSMLTSMLTSMPAARSMANASCARQGCMLRQAQASAMSALLGSTTATATALRNAWIAAMGLFRLKRALHLANNVPRAT